MSEPDPILPPTLPDNAKRPRALVTLSAGGSYQAPVPVYLPGAEPTVRTVLRPRYLQGGGFSGTFQAPAPMVITPQTPLWPDPVGVWLPEETYFDGSTYIEVNASEIISGDGTLAAWVKSETISNNTLHTYVIQYRTYPANQYTTIRRLNLQYDYDGGSGDRRAVATSPTTDVGQWVHIVGRTQGGRVSLWKNGVLLADVAALSIPAMTTIWHLGGQRNQSTGATANFLVGWLQHAMIWNLALTDDEIAALYAAGR